MGFTAFHPSIVVDTDTHTSSTTYYSTITLTLYLGGNLLTLHRSLLNEAEILHHTLPSPYPAASKYHCACFR
jgi:hypothetical protein